MKLERLMAITILLLNRKRVQAQELADRLEVSLVRFIAIWNH